MSYRKRRHSGDRIVGGHDSSPGGDSPSWSNNNNNRHHNNSPTPSPPPSLSPRSPPPPPLSSRRSRSRSRQRSSSYDPIKVGYYNIDDNNDDDVKHNRPHDRALIRALNSELKPTKDHQSDPEKTLFIGRLNSMTTESTLRMHFEKYGAIRSLFLIKDILSGESRRYAFVEYRRHKEADRAYTEAHNSIIDGRRILVDRELGRNKKEWKPRRFGGGYGGYKESGQIRFGGRFNYHRGGGAGGAGPPGRNDYHRNSGIGGGGDRDYSSNNRQRSMPYPSYQPRRSNGYPPTSSSSHHHDNNDSHHHHHSHHHNRSPSPRSYSNGSSVGDSYRRHSSSAGPIRSRR